MGRNRIPWTPQEDALLIENHALSETRLREMLPHRGGSGITQRKVILRRAGKIPASTRRTAVKNWSALGPVVLRMRKEGVSIHNIAAAIGCRDETVRAHLRRHGMPVP